MNESAIVEGELGIEAYGAMWGIESLLVFVVERGCSMGKKTAYSRYDNTLMPKQ